MPITALVTVDDMPASNGTVGAFVDGQLRGVGTSVEIPFGPYAGRHAFAFLVYANVGSETIRFFYHDGVSAYEAAQTLVFDISGDVNSSLLNPFALSFTASVTRTVQLRLGWTWFSLNVLRDDTALGEVLASVAAHSGDFIKSQDQFAEFYPGYGWYGSLSSLCSTKMYAIRLASPQTLSYTAPPVALDTPVPLSAGWNYFPFLLPAETSLACGMPAYEYSGNDFIKSQTGFAQYYAGYGWFGSLATLTPGGGYMLKVSAAISVNYASAMRITSASACIEQPGSSSHGAASEDHPPTTRRELKQQPALAAALFDRENRAARRRRAAL